LVAESVFSGQIGHVVEVLSKKAPQEKTIAEEVSMIPFPEIDGTVEVVYKFPRTVAFLKFEGDQVYSEQFEAKVGEYYIPLA
jgi:hypothetical protein